MDISPHPASQNESIPVQNEQSRKVLIATKRSRTSSESRASKKTVYEEAKSMLFSGAEARNKYYLFIKKGAEEETNFADLNFKQRLDTLRPIVKKFKMKKFRFWNKQVPEYKLGVCVDSVDDMNKLLEIKTIAGCAVIVEENIAKNSIKGLIIDHEDDLIGMDKEALLDAVSSDGVKEIVRYGNSKVIEVSFGGQTKPKDIHFWNELVFPVEDYIEPPTRCFKCQQYGHMSRTCRNDYACYNCGVVYTEKSQHVPRECAKEKRCVNCKGTHASGFKKCEIHKLEMKWASICFNQKIGRSEAKERYPTGVVPKYSGAIERNIQVTQPPIPLQQLPVTIQQPPVVDKNVQAISNLTNQVRSLEAMVRTQVNTPKTSLESKVESLEGMFTTFLSAFNRGSEVDGDSNQVGNSPLVGMMAKLQKEMAEMKQNQEAMKRSYEEEKEQFKDVIKKGKEGFDNLKKKHEETLKENDDLREQVRRLLQSKNVKQDVKETVKVVPSNNLSNKKVSTGNLTQACQPFTPQGSGPNKASAARGRGGSTRGRGGQPPARVNSFI